VFYFRYILRMPEKVGAIFVIVAVVQVVILMLLLHRLNLYLL